VAKCMVQAKMAIKFLLRQVVIIYTLSVNPGKLLTTIVARP